MTKLRNIGGEYLRSNGQTVKFKEEFTPSETELAAMRARHQIGIRFEEVIPKAESDDVALRQPSFDEGQGSPVSEEYEASKGQRTEADVDVGDAPTVKTTRRPKDPAREARQAKRGAKKRGR